MVKFRKLRLSKYSQATNEFVRKWYLRVYLLGLYFDLPLT